MLLTVGCVTRDRQPQHTLGLGIDCSDSLLYEGMTGHARHLIPMFAERRSRIRRAISCFW